MIPLDVGFMKCGVFSRVGNERTASRVEAAWSQKKLSQNGHLVLADDR